MDRTEGIASHVDTPWRAKEETSALLRPSEYAVGRTSSCPPEDPFMTLCTWPKSIKENLFTGVDRYSVGAESEVA